MLVRPTATAHLARIYEPETRTHDWATRLNVAHPNRLKGGSRESNMRRVPGGGADLLAGPWAVNGALAADSRGCGR